ncbi:GAF and ANTAR domain-containing protein [Phytoactinopolyspora halotolerans]|uniref:GAF and ANTAR domain-containing protein n=1 Tax=Phytoactinopolyspora halotolerans TaxID=1981512 RepID=A0A6L9SE49_9ACTN|nr:GAF and ANTAR domain-containing protein [Phytoactinopolyspora halotolerans]NEE03556.1 GAF and ANTAR domain-containing protein [Phytoactinopolyspora halotolerans]
MGAWDPGEFAAMALELQNEPDVEQTLERVVEYAREATGCDDAGLMLLHGGGRIETAVTTHPRVAESDRLQTELGEGPCVRAMWDQDTFRVADTELEQRWPRWGRRIAALGLRSAIGVRLFTLQTTLGALNLYDETPGFFGEDDLEVAEIFGRHASVALADARQESGLREAIGTRQLIGQAQGILMERFGLDADRAFALLRRYSRNYNIKLRNVAQHVVTTRVLPGEQHRAGGPDMHRS